jgi:hypothetical protein
MIDEIILFDRPSSSPEELMQMGVDQSAAEFMFIQSKVDQVTQFAYDLRCDIFETTKCPKTLSTSHA